MDINQQQHLANFAPKQSLDKYSKGADPRVISGIVALSEMQEQAAMRQRANLANGAASGQMPTVRDKIMALFQQSNPQQAQMQPNPMQQGIAARAHPNLQTAPMPEKYAQEAPQEAPEEMYSGGVARLPVRDDMFGYAGGGIIAFNGEDNNQKVPNVTDFDYTSIPQMEKSDLYAKAMEIAKGEGKEKPDNTDIKKALAFVAAPAAAAADVALSIPKGIQSLAGRSFRNPLETKPEGPNFTSVMDARNQFLADGKEPQAPVTGTVVPAPTGKPQLQGPRTLVGDAATEQDRLAKAHAAFQSGQKTVGGYTLSQAIEKARERLEAEGKKLTPDDVRVIQRRFEGATPDAGSGGIKTLPEAKPPATNVVRPPVATPTTTSTPDQTTDWMAEMKKALGPLPAVETPEQRLAARDKYIEKAPTALEALALLKHYDNMANRYAANDQEEKAQQAINARNNLWTFLSNTRGSSLGVAAGKANAALQPLLSAQETRRQTYQKQRDEQEMLLGKARYEIANAERARKEGRYADAEKSELEAKKLQEQARGHIMTGIAAGMRNEETTRHHRVTEQQMRDARTESNRRWELEQQRRQDELAEKERNNRMNNRRLVGGIEKEINKQKEELKRYAGAGNEKIIVEKRAAIEQRIKDLQDERKELLDEIKMPSGYDPSKVKRK